MAGLNAGLSGTATDGQTAETTPAKTDHPALATCRRVMGHDERGLETDGMGVGVCA